MILTDSWRPILRCYYDFLQWPILWEHEECATGFEEIISMSSFCQVDKSEWEPELYLCVNSTKFQNMSSGESAKSGQMTPSFISPDYPNILGQAWLVFQPMRMQGAIRVSRFKTNHKNSRWRTKREPRELCKLCNTFLRKVYTLRECSS